MDKIWRTSEREIDYSQKTLIMGILNTTPDSFSDGGNFETLDSALKQAEKLIEEGVDILDVGGESTRPNTIRVETDEEIKRTAPVIEGIKKRFEIPVSIDTSKALVAEAAISSGAEIINDISGLRFDKKMAAVASKLGTGLVLMHLRGEFDTMHKQDPSDSIIDEVTSGLRKSIQTATKSGVGKEQICLDIGIGFSKTHEQNCELIAKLRQLRDNFPAFPMLVGVSRKSFIGKILAEKDPGNRLAGTIAANVISVFNGANIVRVHDVKEHVQAAKIADSLLSANLR